MLSLIGPCPPANREELIVALTGGLNSMLHLPADRTVVEVAGAHYPTLDKLRIDVTGATVRETYRPRLSTGPHQPGITAAQLEIVGRQLRYQQVAVDFALQAQEACFAICAHAPSGHRLDPIAAQQGHFQARMSHADLESLLRAAFQSVAARHGLLIEKTELAFECPDERSVLVQVRVVGSKRMAFMSIRAVLHGRGRLVIDETLQATLSGLSCQGEGVVGQILVGLMQAQIQQWEGRSFPLTAFSLGKLQLRDLKIGYQAGLQVEAVLES
ncbi:MAG: hypothetical protein L0Z62_17815 [Gemmataceae bacterium]|nr:hypothetical protein [Gemmataceae bacterium]